MPVSLVARPYIRESAPSPRRAQPEGERDKPTTRYIRWQQQHRLTELRGPPTSWPRTPQIAAHPDDTTHPRPACWAGQSTDSPAGQLEHSTANQFNDVSSYLFPPSLDERSNVHLNEAVRLFQRKHPARTRPASPLRLRC